MKKSGLVFSYASAVFAAVLLRRFYNTADSDALIWILAPVAWWVKLLGGITFEYIAKVGYVSERYRFVIAASCAGVRFLVLTFLMMVFSFTHRLGTGRKKALWFLFSAGFAYVTTVIVNGIRITGAIYIPLMLFENGSVQSRLVSDGGASSLFLPNGLTAQRLHTMIGTAVYFSALFVLYALAEKICIRMFGAQCRENEAFYGKKITAPIFWYAAIVLFLPFLSRLYHNEWNGFLQYAVLVAGVCIAVGVVFTLIGFVISIIRRGKTRKHIGA